MRDDQLRALEEIYGVTTTSFIHYLMANAEVQVASDFDRKVRSFFVDWHRASELNRTAFLDLLSEHGYTPSTFGFPLNYSEYHYLNASYLLKPVIRLMQQNLHHIKSRAEKLGDWESARKLVDAVVGRETPFLEKAKELEKEAPHEAPARAKIRGTSASRW